MVDSVEKMLRHLGRGVALGALVDGRIYGQDLPDDPVLPCVVVRLEGGGAATESDLLWPDFEIACYAERLVSDANGPGALDVDAALYDWLTTHPDLEVSGFASMECDSIGRATKDPDWPEWDIVESEWSGELVNG